ncbi:hypothetical protein BC829DRAFT_403161 [Chytridium lagenaria]|nr:hypothetical protein BC829DRAFT_403161 [Chytridium lagenaria]
MALETVNSFYAVLLTKAENETDPFTAAMYRLMYMAHLQTLLTIGNIRLPEGIFAEYYSRTYPLLLAEGASLEAISERNKEGGVFEKMVRAGKALIWEVTYDEYCEDLAVDGVKFNSPYNGEASEDDIFGKDAIDSECSDDHIREKDNNANILATDRESISTAANEAESARESSVLLQLRRPRSSTSAGENKNVAGSETEDELRKTLCSHNDSNNFEVKTMSGSTQASAAIGVPEANSYDEHLPLNQVSIGKGFAKKPAYANTDPDERKGGSKLITPVPNKNDTCLAIDMVAWEDVWRVISSIASYIYSSPIWGWLWVIFAILLWTLWDVIACKTETQDAVEEKSEQHEKKNPGDTVDKTIYEGSFRLWNTIESQSANTPNNCPEVALPVYAMISIKLADHSESSKIIDLQNDASNLTILRLVLTKNQKKKLKKRLRKQAEREKVAFLTTGESATRPNPSEELCFRLPAITLSRLRGDPV